MIRRNCGHKPIDAAKFCHQCGKTTIVMSHDYESKKEFCGKCNSRLEGYKQYCIHWGEPSPLAGIGKKQSPIQRFVNSPYTQATIIGVLLFLAVGPMVLPFSYVFTSQAPFVKIVSDEDKNRKTAAPLPEQAASFDARPLLADVDSIPERFRAGGAAVDRLGNIYVADSNGHKVYVIRQSGEWRTIAGNGKPGFSGDGDLAAKAMLNTPQGVAIDGWGNVYIADSGNNLVRMVDPKGVLHTIAGNTETDDGNTSKHLCAPSSLRIEDDNTLYVREHECGDDTARDPTIWVLSRKFRTVAATR